MLGIDSGTLPPSNARIFIGLMLCSFWEGNCWCWKLMSTTILLCSQVNTFLLFSIHLLLHYFVSNIDFYHTIYYDNIFSLFQHFWDSLTSPLSGITLFLSLLEKKSAGKRENLKPGSSQRRYLSERVFTKLDWNPEKDGQVPTLI